MMGKVQKPSNSVCYTPLSEPLRIYKKFIVFASQGQGRWNQNALVGFLQHNGVNNKCQFQATSLKVLVPILTNSIQLCLSREATGCSATQWITNILWNARAITIHCQIRSISYTFLRTSAICKSVYALPTTLYGEDIQNGTHIPGPWSRITSGDVAAANMWWHLRKSSADARALRNECMVHLVQNEGSFPWQEKCQ
jgi:hypothetical protein